MKKFATAALLAVGLGLVGCTTTTTAPADASPAGVVIPSSILSARPDVGHLVVRRDSGLMGIACGHAIRLDGKFIATLGAGEEVTAFPTPGEHTLEASSTGVWCGANAVGGASFVLDAGQSRAFRTGFSGMFGLSVSQISESRASAAPVPAKTQAARPAIEDAKPLQPAGPAGKDAFAAERIARTEQCSASPSAQLATRGAGFEIYTVACSGGNALSIRCEFGNCRVLR